MNDIQLREDALFERISALIDLARKRVKTAIDTTMVYTYYGVGHYIVEDVTFPDFTRHFFSSLTETVDSCFGVVLNR